MNRVKTAKPIEMAFEDDIGQTEVSPRNHVINGGMHRRHEANTIKRSVFGSNAGCIATITVATC